MSSNTYQPINIILLSGLSGSGKSVALRLFEDLGYTCVDNLPVTLIAQFVEIAQSTQARNIAIALDARTPGAIADLPSIVQSLRAAQINIRVLFLDSNTHTLVSRYSESRRPHPLTDRLKQQGLNPSLEHCIDAERELLASCRDLGHVIDTSHLSTSQFRAWIKQLINTQSLPLILTFQSFAFKHGLPMDADLVFDARCLPNPYYDLALRPLTGKDQAVKDFFKSAAVAQSMRQDIIQFIDRWLPAYTQDTRSYLTVAIGCTGGQHRSVYLVESIAKYYSKNQETLIRHRAQPQLHT